MITKTNSFLRAQVRFAASNINFNRKCSSKAIKSVIGTHKKLTNVEQITVTKTPIFDKENFDGDFIGRNQAGSFREYFVRKSRKKDH